MIGFGLGFLALVGGLTQSGIYNPAVAIGLASRGMDGVVMAIVGQFVAVFALVLLIRAPQSSAD